ncbi:SA1362 family protein [Sutcliffiella horikoshii]|uniref:SA1362 family protein n=1 Tax=Sutcliffiella horikoshii TaxID=79883 RepID=UPI001CBE268E|nr:SA1362 family protein [Sutcliffiella horikoshii]UAL46078.1 hypothetical protein K7887_14205 [Sutcliffiella horikoshii]
MKRSYRKLIFYALVSLAAFYLIIQLFTNPGGLFTSLLLIVGGATVFYLIFRYFIQGKIGAKTDARYSKAVKQSKKKYAATGNAKPTISPITSRDRASSKPSKPAVPKRKAPSHLTVIEGKKGKKKNRAFF